MLSERYAADTLESLLLPPGTWHPYPTAADRAAWEALPAAVRRAHVRRGEQVLETPWQVLPATVFLEYARNGNRTHYEHLRDQRRGRLADLVVAECMEGRGRFLDAMVDGIWLTLEETYWGVPAHIRMQRAGTGLPDVDEPTVDLFVGETVSLLAWTLYLLEPQLAAISPLVPARIRGEAQRRVLTPCLERDDFWWMGFDGRPVNNWNPWCNSNWLAAALLLESDPERRHRAVAKILRSLDRFIDPYPPDGGCDEGPGYWGRAGASLFDCLDLLHGASAGRIDVFQEPLIQDMGRFIYRVQIAGRYFVNFADASALVVPSPGVVFRYGQRIADPDMVSLGAWAAQQQGVLERGAGDSLQRQLPLLFALEELAARPARAPLPRDVWLPGIQVMVARDTAGCSQGLCVAAKAGHNAESHNHNDVGNFLVYVDGRPALVDAGVEQYSAKTFSAQRYEIWTMQSAYHNLPDIAGEQQAAGRQYAARDVEYVTSESRARLRMDVAAAYPAAAAVRSWVREVVLERSQAVVVRDTFDLSAAPAALCLNLLTPSRVDVRDDGLWLQPRQLAPARPSAAAHIRVPSGVFRIRVEEVRIQDPRLAQVWGEQLFRIVLEAIAPAAAGVWELSIHPGGAAGM